ncbi:VWA domain-containing protein [Ottowia sp. GY511]|uniref:VWA domain-containing protein n=1 Tax=Ottowia flava TaxID=2675430 RepID=A0ABW4KVJ0_9BURK|nr:VWA domain-containing protein [Ottowia sp. GY511]TXK31347.1 VWA domain-containing protein [Ottowia sp. GY511]
MPSLHPVVRATAAAFCGLSVLLAPAQAASPVVIAPGETSPPSFVRPVWPGASAANAFTRDRVELRRAGQEAIARGQAPFQSPSAPNCRRPMRSHEEPGTQASAQDLTIGGAVRRRAGDLGRPEVATEAAPLPAPAGAVMDKSTHEAALAAPAPAEATGNMARTPSARIARAEPVTAGMVDDNAQFSEYLAFRERTQVIHRERDVRERVLLQVRDPRGRAMPDAEVAVRASSGAIAWARTDTAGRAWISPDAFDPQASKAYQVTVRRGAAESSVVFLRGQQSAVDVTLDLRVPAQRARLDLVFLIDATGSMADEIAKLKTTLHSIADEVARLPSQPDTCFGLVAYRDKTDAFLLRSHDFTGDLGAFQKVLDDLQAGGGGDEPEAMNEALFEAVHALSWRGTGATRLMVLLADAPPHLDYAGPQYDESMLAALGKGIKVFSVGASGLNKQGEFIQRQIAQYTGGRFVFLTYADAREPGSGPGRKTVHDVANYSVDTLDRLIVRLVSDELAQLPAPKS